MRNQDVQDLIEEKFSHHDAGTIQSFLGRSRFSEKGEPLILKLFFSAKDKGIDPSKVLRLCEGTWENVWKFQPVAFRGDPDAIHPMGEDTRIAFKFISETLEVPDPCEEGLKKVVNVAETV